MKLKLEEWFPTLNCFSARDAERHVHIITKCSGGLHLHPDPAALVGREIECGNLYPMVEMACGAHLLPAEDVAAETAAS